MKKKKKTKTNTKKKTKKKQKHNHSNNPLNTPKHNYRFTFRISTTAITLHIPIADLYGCGQGHRSNHISKINVIYIINDLQRY
ncbi:hypothetical protein BLOT_002609 [Blomia tropicalis]|nr:hypothetical protein BLOT_002609 [Blomia tropicalis]